MQSRMNFDDVAWEQSEVIEDAWIAGLFETDTLKEIGNLIVKHRKGVPVELCDATAGGFNVCFRMKFEDSGSAIIRFPKPGIGMFPEEKVRNEVAVMKYLRDHTSIPVPVIIHWGTKEESPPGLGPFIIMEYIDYAMDLSTALNTPGLDIKDRPVLDPHIDNDKLEMLYGQLADILLQLSRLSFPRIGSLSQIDDSTWEIARRPLSINMNELHLHISKPLAELHTEHLTQQRNDAVDSADDCRRKFVARRLFRKIARDGRLTSSFPKDSGPFKIWCDDLRPSNVLVDADLKIVGVVDWEFTYAAPAEFSYAPPWWLLLEQPDYWPDGIEAWGKRFEHRLQTFLKVLLEREAAALEQGNLKEDQRLSGPMQQSWENGDFWVIYAARKNFAFDAIFWRKLDDRFFGPSGVSEQDRWKERIDLLDQEEKNYMEEFVSRKLEEMKERILAWEPEEGSEC
ncbi:hypothetical protein AOCH_007160 [Aspergillus ochraceoroseus]|uniref:Aminoglycoside phosphotransferase domain-containing protein n=1 Tax=Aspergillus ochraceoroseus TaxID=138278 RepID=A0A0F8WJM9_9EURO|nr:hypothetical protein AOCH_007160 [Aspergillus ochraceoroseus]